MSSDQRPGKVRVFSSGTMPEQARRWDDDADPGQEFAAIAIGPATGRSDKPGGFGNTLLRAVMFLIGCVGGGALLAWLGLIPGGGQ